MRNHQQGMTLIGLLFVLAMAGVIVYAGIRLAPLYLNYLKVARTMESVATEVKGENPDQGEIRNLISRHFNIEDPTGVTEKDIEVIRDDGGVQMHVVYDDSAPFLGNVSFTAHFEKTVTVR